MRQLFMASKHWIESGVEPINYQANEGPSSYTDLSWENAAQNLKLDFVWAPIVNESMKKSLQRWNTGPGPTVIVIGAGAHSINISNGSDVQVFLCAAKTSNLSSLFRFAIP